MFQLLLPLSFDKDSFFAAQSLLGRFTSMTMKSRIELRRTAYVTIFVAVFLILAVGFLTPTYLRYRAMRWEQMFRSAQMYREFMTAFTAILFGAAPSAALLLAGVAAAILKNTRGSEDDANAAS
jgi:hypothetical protein